MSKVVPRETLSLDTCREVPKWSCDLQGVLDVGAGLRNILHM